MIYDSYRDQCAFVCQARDTLPWYYAAAVRTATSASTSLFAVPSCSQCLYDHMRIAIQTAAIAQFTFPVDRYNPLAK
jgi:hypothetical protein